MKPLKLISDYRDNDRYRDSFNRLSRKVFNISFEKWYEHGFWDDRYVCYSYADGDDVVANVSLNKLDLILDEKRQKAAQVGTVMTHPEYRRRGLAGELIKAVLKDCQEGDYDVIYAVGDASLRDYYPRFGFDPVLESQFISCVEGPPCDARLRKLHPSDPADLNLIRRLSTVRKPNSRVFGVDNARGILMWYCFNVLGDCFSYWEEQDVAVVSTQKGPDLHLFDVISAEAVAFEALLPRIITGSTERVIFHFTPDLLDVAAQAIPIKDEDVFFVIGGRAWTGPMRFKHPATAQA